jgi:hypothetical protein
MRKKGWNMICIWKLSYSIVLYTLHVTLGGMKVLEGKFKKENEMLCLTKWYRLVKLVVVVYCWQLILSFYTLDVIF